MQAKLVENIRINNGKLFIFQHFTERSGKTRGGQIAPGSPFAKLFSEAGF